MRRYLKYFQTLSKNLKKNFVYLEVQFRFKLSELISFEYQTQPHLKCDVITILREFQDSLALI